MSWIDSVKCLRKRMSSSLLPQPVVFHHVPKCGGTSLGRALRLRYLLSQSTIDTQASFKMANVICEQETFAEQWSHAMQFRENMLLYLMYRNVRCISAHVAFSPKAFAHFAPHYQFVTLLRDPVQRYISHVLHAQRPGAHFSTSMSIDEYLLSEGAAHLGQRYVEYFSGSYTLNRPVDNEQINAAKQNLDNFSAVGFLDNLGSFQVRLNECLGTRLRIGHANARWQNAEETHVSDGTLKRIQELCAADIEIYEYARRQFLNHDNG